MDTKKKIIPSIYLVIGIISIIWGMVLLIAMHI
jgi:hypothetical protein